MTDLVFLDTDRRLRQCAWCSSIFTVKYPSDRRRFCGRKCSTSSYAYRPAERNSNWRGGRTKHPLYDVYLAMIARCHNPDHRSYPRYGARGITVCGRWRDNFWHFVADMGDRPLAAPGGARPFCSIDRIDNNGPYSPENTRWATAKQQADNAPRRRPQERDTTSGRFVPYV